MFVWICLFVVYAMSSLYPSLSPNQPTEEMELQDYPKSGMFWSF